MDEEERALQACERAVIICTSADRLGDVATGAWFEEIAAPYWVLSHKTDVDIASVAGGKVPLDPGSMQGDFYTESCKAFEGRPDAMHKLENSLKVEDLDPEKYGIVFLAGGHGTCVDFVDNEELGKFLKAVRVKKWNVVSAVCHGVIGLFNMGTDWKDGIRMSTQVTGFSDAEEAQVGKTDLVPFSIEDKFKELGWYYQEGDPWQVNVVVDGKIVTGQNPQSSADTARAALKEKFGEIGKLRRP